MKKKIINGLLLLAVVFASSSTLVSCKDTASDDLAEVKEQLSEEQALRVILQNQITELKTTINNCGCEIPFKQDYLDRLAAIEQQLSNNGGGITLPGSGSTGGTGTILEWILAVNQMLGNLQTYLTTLQGNYDALLNKFNDYVLASSLPNFDEFLKTGALDGYITDAAVRTLLEGYVKSGDYDFASFVKTSDLANYVTSAALAQLLNGYAKTADLPDWSQFLKSGDIDLTPYITNEALAQLLADYAKTADLPDWTKFLTETDLANYVKTSDLDAYAKLTDLEKFLTQKDLVDYVTTSMLEDYAKKSDLDNFINTVNSWDLVNKVSNLESWQYTVNEKISTIEGNITELTTNVNNMIEAVASMATKTELANTKAELEGKITDLTTQINDLNVQLTSYYNELKEQISNVESTLTESINNLEQRVATNEATLGELKTLVGQMNESIEDLKTRVTNLETAVEELKPQVEENKENIEKIIAALNAEVSGIIIQGAYSPVFGIGSLPLDVKTNFLAAYYGYATTSGLEFPALDDLNYVNKKQFWASDVTDIIDFDKVEGAVNLEPQALITSELNDDNTKAVKADAGKIYVTVNPNTVDFEGKVITMESSNGTTSPIYLSPLAKSDYTIHFGWNRAASNGFYEATATINAEDVPKATVKINRQEMIDAAKAFYHNRTRTGLTNFASEMYSQLKAAGESMPAYAAKATWQVWDFESKQFVDRSVYSGYDMANIVANPLSFNTLYGWNPKRIPGLDRVEHWLSTFFEKIVIKIDLGMGNIVAPTIGHINIKPFESFDTNTWVITVTIPSIEISNSQTVNIHIAVNGDVYFTEHWDEENDCPHINPATGEKYDADGHLVIDQNIDQPLTVEAETGDITVHPNISAQLKEVYDAFAEPLTDVNETLDNLQKFVDQINDILANLNGKINSEIDKAKNSIRDQLIGYLDKLEQKILSKSAYVNQALQPVLLIRDGDSFKLTSKIKNYPSKPGVSEINFVATTYNGELLTPAFRKFVVVSNAWKNGVRDINAAKKANADNDLLKVQKGGVLTIPFKGEAGVLYEITYQAVDYHGRIASFKHYVQF